MKRVIVRNWTLDRRLLSWKATSRLKAARLRRQLTDHVADCLAALAAVDGRLMMTMYLRRRAGSRRDGVVNLSGIQAAADTYDHDQSLLLFATDCQSLLVRRTEAALFGRLSSVSGAQTHNQFVCADGRDEPSGMALAESRANLNYGPYCDFTCCSGGRLRSGSVCSAQSVPEDAAALAL